MDHAIQWLLDQLGQPKLLHRADQIVLGKLHINVMKSNFKEIFTLYNISITDIVTASPSGLTKSSLQSLGSRQWYIDVTWSPSSTQVGPSIFCYSALDSIR